MEKQIQYFCLKDIADSGQCFRMERVEDATYSLIAFEKKLTIRQEGDRLFFECSEEDFDQIWEDYFDLKRDYGLVRSSVDEKDAYLIKAMQFGQGIRILKQDLWEMILTFLISQQNNIKRIKKCINFLCEKYGKRMELEDGSFYFSFPTPEALKDVSEEELRNMNFGYRARYIEKTVKSILDGEVDLSDMVFLSYEEAREELKKLSGVGEKVADCICLFGLGHMEAFPIDTHIKNVLKKEYPQGFPFERYRSIAGIIQQYLFYYDLKG